MTTITDQARIKETLHAYMLKPGEQRAPFLVQIRTKRDITWNGRPCPPGIIIEGPRPISCVTHCDTGDVVYNLSNSDSNYRQTIGQVRLADIEFIETLN